MEEDIKILESIKRTSLNGSFDKQTERLKALENLLTRYKQLEQENRNFKEAIFINKREYQNVCNKNKELEAIINLMAEEIASYNRYEAGALDEKEEVIKFYTNKVEKEGE